LIPGFPEKKGKIVNNNNRVCIACLSASCIHVARPPVAPSLSPRELSVLRQLSAFLTGKEMAVNLGLTESTVKQYQQRVYRKLGLFGAGAGRRAGLWARQHAGLIGTALLGEQISQLTPFLPLDRNDQFDKAA
jgi:DNA-binding CsgD family transcriptional regulator